MSEVVVGVFSGVLAAWVLGILKSLIQKVLIPWYQAKIFSGIEIAGEWHGTRVDGNATYTFDLSIEQKGNILSGIFTAVDKFPDHVNTRSFKLEGIELSGHVILTYTPRSRRVWGGGTFMFQIYDGGDSLRGAMSYIRTKSGNVQAKDDIILKRRQ